MPELPEVEAICRTLREQAVGMRITSAKVYRCADPEVAGLVRGRRVEGVERRGKHILLRLSDGVTLDTHLRMSGHLYLASSDRRSAAAARVVLRLAGGWRLILEDPRALARMRAVATERIDREMQRLGAEPLSPRFTADWLVREGKRSPQAAKLWLMNQRHVAGLGNIYAAEALFRACIPPGMPMRRLSAGKLRRLHAAIVGVLRDAVQSAWTAYSGPGKFGEAEAFRLAVYGREGDPCQACGRRIRRLLQGGRSTYYCPGCQRYRGN